MPGDSVKIALENNSYLLYVTGKTSGEVVNNYKLMMKYEIEGTEQTVVLFESAMMPFPNTTDIVPEFIEWAGDLNNDNLLDIIFGSGVKSCATIDLWMGEGKFRFIKKATFEGCGC
jgi:hypothetical protein